MSYWGTVWQRERAACDLCVTPALLGVPCLDTIRTTCAPWVLCIMTGRLGAHLLTVPGARREEAEMQAEEAQAEAEVRGQNALERKVHKNTAKTTAI